MATSVTMQAVASSSALCKSGFLTGSKYSSLVRNVKVSVVAPAILSKGLKGEWLLGYTSPAYLNRSIFFQARDELLSDPFPYTKIQNGIMWEVEGKWVVQGAVEFDVRGNPSAKGGGEDEGVEDSIVKVVDTFRVQEQPTFKKKALLALLKKYIQNVAPKLSGEGQDEFKKNVGDAVKLFLRKVKELQL